MFNEFSTKSLFSPYFIRGHLSPYFIRGHLLLKQKTPKKKKQSQMLRGGSRLIVGKKRLGEVANLLRRKHMHTTGPAEKHFMNGESRRGGPEDGSQPGDSARVTVLWDAGVT